MPIAGRPDAPEAPSESSPMSAKRNAGSPNRAAASPDRSAITNALLVAAAMAWGSEHAGSARAADLAPATPFSTASRRSPAAWPWSGPFILFRSGEIQGSLGELAWLTVGLLIWTFDLVALAQGQWRTIPWATPLSDRTLGLMVLAVLVAGWRCGLAQRNWSWTNVLGCVLGAFWVGMAVCSWLMSAPGRPSLATL